MLIKDILNIYQKEMEEKSIITVKYYVVFSSDEYDEGDLFHTDTCSEINYSDFLYKLKAKFYEVKGKALCIIVDDDEYFELKEYYETAEDELE